MKLPIKIETDERVILQLTPDPTVHSGRAVESMLNTFHSMYEHFTDRVWYEDGKLVYKTSDFVSYRIVFEQGRITFYLIVPSRHRESIIHSINNVWPKVAITSAQIDLNRLTPQTTVGGYVELRDHYFKSILVDRTQAVPIPSLMSAGRNVVDDDLAVLDITFLPVGRRWQYHAQAARNKFRRGMDVKKRPTSLLDFGYVIGDFLADSVVEKFMGLVDIMVGADEKEHKEMEPWERALMTKRLRQTSEQKVTHAGFDVVIRIASHSVQRSRAELTLRAIGTAFKDLSADNEFDLRRVKVNQRFINGIMLNNPPLFRLNGNILSIPECSQIYQLPSGAIQEEYPEIERIPMREVQVNHLLRQGGMLLGEVVYKKQTVPIYQPTTNVDELCLPNVAIGGMGQGKTRGFMANWLVECYRNGYGGLAIDAAKREIGDEIQYAVDKGVIPAQDFIRINLGNTPMSLDWKEATVHEKGKSRLASTILDFFHIDEDTTGQTGRFLRAVVLSMHTGKMHEIIEILENEDRIDQALSQLKPGTLTYTTMEQYKRSSPDRRRQIASPIYNRLDMIIGDEYLAECMDSDYELNMIDLMSQRKIIVIDLPDDELIGAQTDIMVNLLCAKIDLAMRMRRKVHGVKAEFPFFVLMDEPHKYLRSAKIWEAACVESRKWRVGYVWSFHYWEQIPSELQKAIKNALPHYHLYPTSKLTWKSLEEEIKPFTVEEMMKLKSYHALNIIRAGDGYLDPVMARMSPPPHIRFRSTGV
jgi:hypothetical protein